MANNIGGKEVGAELALLLDDFSQMDEVRRRNYRSFVGFDFSGLNLYDRDLEYCNLDGAKFSGAYLRMTHFKGALLDKAIFDNAYMEEVDFSTASMKAAVLTGSHLSNYAKLNGTDLSGAVLLDLAGHALGHPGVGAVWMIGTKLIGADLRGFVFPSETIANVNLDGSNLCGADLSKLDVEKMNITLKDSQFDETTKLPKLFWPRKHGMHWVGKVS